MELDAARVAQHLVRSRRRFLDAATVALTTEIETYANLPHELIHGEIEESNRAGIELYVKTLTTGEMPAPGDLEQIRLVAARRARAGLPLDMLITAYPLVARVLLTRLVSATNANQVSVSSDLVGLTIDFLGAVTSAAASAYLEESQLIETGSRTEADRMLESLLIGAPRPTVHGIQLADEYAVFALSIAPHPDEHQPGVDAGLVARRKLGRAKSVLRQVCGSQPMTSLTPEGGLALVPAGRATSPWSELVERLSAAAQAPVTAALTMAPTDDIAAAALLSGEILDVVALIGRPPGCYSLHDVSFEYQITRPGAARSALASTLNAVEDDQVLLTTLRAFLTSGGNRHRTARQVSSHPNTVDNRMRKLARLTGCDPMSSDGATRLRMALLAQDAEQRTIQYRQRSTSIDAPAVPQTTAARKSPTDTARSRTGAAAVARAERESQA